MRKNSLRRSWQLASFGLAAVVILAWPSTSRAEGERVVILDFDGQRGSQTRGAVVGVLRDRLFLIPLAEFEQGAQDAGATDFAGSDLPAACRASRAAAAISGEVIREGGLVLRLTLRNCADGEVLDLYTVPFRGRRINTNALRTQLDELVVRVAAAEAPPEREEREHEEPDDQDLAGDEDGTDDDGEDGDDDDDDDDDETESTEPFLDASLVLGIASRSLEVASQSGDISSVVYEGGLYSEIGIDLHFYPLRLGSEGGFASNLGLHLGLGRHLIASSKPKDETGGGDVDTSLLWFDADVFGLFPIGSDPYPLRVGGSLGWGLKDFDLGDNEYVASFGYRFFRIGIEGHYPLVEDSVVAFLGLGYRLVTGVGDAEAFYGPDSSAGGLDGKLGVHGSFAGNFIYQASVELISFSLSFSQPAGATPPTLEGGDGNDTYFQGRVSIGYAFQ